jgi:hypothetical protein
VQYPWLLKWCASIAVRLLDVIWILTPNFFNYMGKFVISSCECYSLFFNALATVLWHWEERTSYIIKFFCLPISLCSVCAMKTYGGVDVQIHTFLTSTLVRGEWSASCPGRFTPRERANWYPLVRRLVGLQSLSGWHGEQKILDSTGTQALSLQSSSP